MFKVTKFWTWTLKATLWESQDTSLTLSNCLFREKAIKNMYKIQKSSKNSLRRLHIPLLPVVCWANRFTRICLLEVAWNEKSELMLFGLLTTRVWNGFFEEMILRLRSSGGLLSVSGCYESSRDWEIHAIRLDSKFWTSKFGETQGSPKRSLWPMLQRSSLQENIQEQKINVFPHLFLLISRQRDCK